jgi:hypothetical protein
MGASDQAERGRDLADEPGAGVGVIEGAAGERGGCEAGGGAAVESGGSVVAQLVGDAFLGCGY